MKRTVTVLVLVLVAVGAGLLLQQRTTSKHDAMLEVDIRQEEERERQMLYLENVQVDAEVVRTPQERQQGLSGRASLPLGSGMLFVFESPEMRTFWMKDMNFAIDIIWLDGSWQVISVTENATPDTFPDTFSPTRPAQYVLEVPAFFARDNGITTGTQARVE